MELIKLSSGNRFYYQAATSKTLAYGFIISPNDVFVGGFLGKEAVRKRRIFRKLAGVQISQGYYDLRKADLSEFAKKLGSVGAIFKSSFFLEVRDLRDCDGTRSKAESCDERHKYYCVVGLGEAFKTNKRFLLGLFVANHVAIFSLKHFRETFFRGRDVPQKDDELEVHQYSKNVYVELNFKAPAAYVRALVSKR